ncbi:MAG: TIGR03435 family protein [Candidatus Sulfopaludibacter sp.]|nr:TIGR03435 family protein [Candidatus Sulfopaludibacter sp.]
MTGNLLIVAAMFLCLSVWAQPSAGPEFDAAWVKPNPSTNELSVLIPANAKLLAKHVSLMRLISFAYDIPYARISGPSWLDADAFDIQAKGKFGSKDADVRLMTRALLAERFGLQCHRETKEARVYFLVPGGGGFKLVPADEPTPHRPNFPPSPHSTMGGDGTMEDLASHLSRYAGAPVIDRTEVAGEFHYYLWWGRNPETDPDIFQAVKEQLGLKLQAGKDNVEFLVVDHASRTPTEN